MNKELKDRVFDIPVDVLTKIDHTIFGLQGKGVKGLQRAKKLSTEKKVKYGQLKRIIHDLENIDKVNERQRYDLYGGDLMLNWGKKFLGGERDLIKTRKMSKMKSDERSGLTGERKNSHLKKHKKRFNFRIPTNLIKSNSSKSTISPITTLGLMEEINKFKKLISY
jgi:hypothetical protein